MSPALPELPESLLASPSSEGAGFESVGVLAPLPDPLPLPPP
ncbi:hypothetical protein [Ligilactobacillus salivarius]|nr:hypothetical protein [Ligilactobacillus salivarius]